MKCSKCNQPATKECKDTPNGGWGTMKCGKPLCKKCKCDCTKILVW